MREVAVIQGIPRKKKNRSVNPNDPLEIDKSKVAHTIRYYPPVGVVGFPGSGRKTLAYRFSKEGEGPFTEEVPVRNVYGCHYLDKCLDEDRGAYGEKLEFCLLLKLYIIDPSTLSPHTPPLRLQDWNEFCCMLIVFDINDRRTFNAVPSYIRILRQPYFNIQDELFIVGNKSDLRRTDDMQRTQVTRAFAERMANRLGGTYYECSAKQDIDVFDILWAVIFCSPLIRYIVE